MPEERPLVAAVIYNRLAAGNPLGIDATIRYDDQNYDEQLTEIRARRRTPRTTPASNAGPAADPDRQSRPRLDRGGRQARPRRDVFYFVVKPGTCSEHVFVETEEEFAQAEAGVPAGARRSRAARRPSADAPCPGSPSSATRSRTRARRRCRPPRSPSWGSAAQWTYEAIEVVARALRRAGRARCPATASPASTSPCPHKLAALAVADRGLRRPRARSAPRTRSASAPRRGRRREHRRGRDHRARSASRSPAAGRSCSAPAARPGPPSGRCATAGAEVVDLEPDRARRPRRWPPSSAPGGRPRGRAACDRRLRPDRQRHHARPRAGKRATGHVPRT